MFSAPFERSFGASFLVNRLYLLTKNFKHFFSGSTIVPPRPNGLLEQRGQEVVKVVLQT